MNDWVAWDQMDGAGWRHACIRMGKMIWAGPLRTSKMSGTLYRTLTDPEEIKRAEALLTYYTTTEARRA